MLPMGKSVSPYSHLLDQLESQFAPFRRALTREDQARFDRLFSHARRRVPAGVMQSDPDPFRTAVLGMLIEILARLDGDHAPDRD
jgi:hypothetical protein